MVIYSGLGEQYIYCLKRVFWSLTRFIEKIFNIKYLFNLREVWYK